MTNPDKSPDILLHGLRKSLLHLIPETRARLLFGNEASAIAKSGRTISVANASAGAVTGERDFTLFFKAPWTAVTAIQLRREVTPFSKAERKVLSAIPKALVALISLSENRGYAMAQKLSAAFTHDHILISRILRGTGSGTYLTPALTLRLLQNLTFFRYESQPATSGIIFTNDPVGYLKKLDPSLFDFSPFNAPQSLSIDFFDQPASYRYIDGKNAYYLIDNCRKAKHFVQASLHKHSHRQVGRMALSFRGCDNACWWPSWSVKSSRSRKSGSSIFVRPATSPSGGGLGAQ